jgi:hypothetical protein
VGKYTSLAEKLRTGNNDSREVINNKSVKINNINKATTSNSVGPEETEATPLRPYAVNAVVHCIHGLKEDECAVCSGYVRWLIADENRVRRAMPDPEGVRQEFWEYVNGSDWLDGGGA